MFGKVDTEAQVELAARYDIRSIPTLMALRDGVIVFSQPGALPESAVESLISQVRELDMEDVRKQLAEHASPRALRSFATGRPVYYGAPCSRSELGACNLARTRVRIGQCVGTTCRLSPPRRP